MLMKLYLDSGKELQGLRAVAVLIAFGLFATTVSGHLPLSLPFFPMSFWFRSL